MPTQVVRLKILRGGWSWFKPRGTYPAFGSTPLIGKNLQAGARISYWRKDGANKDVKLASTSEAGDSVGTVTSRGNPGYHTVTQDDSGRALVPSEHPCALPTPIYFVL